MTWAMSGFGANNGHSDPKFADTILLKAQSLITPQLMALTSGDNLHIIGVHGAARDSLRADGVEHNVGAFDRTAALDTVLRAYFV
jgi:hypothetical protein